jgi:hypothetical protein
MPLLHFKYMTSGEVVTIIDNTTRLEPSKVDKLVGESIGWIKQERGARMLSTGTTLMRPSIQWRDCYRSALGFGFVKEVRCTRVL